MKFFITYCSSTLLILLLSFSSTNSQIDTSKRTLDNRKDNKVAALLVDGELILRKNPDKALDFGLQALVLAKKLGQIQEEASALSLLAEANFLLGQLENSLRYYNRALGIYEKLNQKENQIRTYIGLSKVYEASKNPELAIQYLNRANTILDDNVSVTLQIELKQYLGSFYQKQGNYKNAISTYMSILDKLDNPSYQRVKNKDKIRVNCLIQIGQSEKNAGELDKSLISFKRATAQALSNKDTVSYANTLRELAISFYLLQKLDSASYNFTLSYNISRSLTDTSGMILSLQGLGDVNLELGNINQAINFYSQQLALSENKKDIPNSVSSLVKISRCHYALGDYPTSSRVLNRALALAKSQNLTESKADVYRYLALIYETQGRHKDALDFYKMWIEIRDSIYSEETGQKLAKLQILYDITQKEKENEILKQNSEIQRLQLAKSRYQGIILFSLVIAFVVLSLFLVMLFSAKQKEFKKQKETEQRITDINKELERRMIQEIKKQEKQQQLLAQKSKLESLGTLAAGIAHEINQPLGGISMGLDNILLKTQEDNINKEYLKDKVNLLFENVERIKKIIDHIRYFSRTQKPVSFVQVNINDVIKSALFMVSAQYENHGVIIETNLDESAGMITADKYKLEQVLLNLLSNSKYAIDEKAKRLNDGKFRKRIEIKSYKDSDFVYISLMDNGIGISSKIIDKIFDPFFTTKSEEKGTGLGLSISYGFIKDILGAIKVESVENEYTVFEISIPKE
ncbi:MAG TPA: tetratricopeptide repeat protein [Tenuifilaceae bacterium]|nr:tetratricopeptide repeat protein [Tenuifilaceae bacterium]HPI45084.1 tetratricopeptide repeat protein [Tenuifilaceae bacterium]